MTGSRSCKSVVAAFTMASAVVLPGSSPALAQPKASASAVVTKPPRPLTEAQKKVAARKAYKDGEAKLKEAKYDEALVAYRLADELIAVPAAKYKIAVCRDRLGLVLEAASSYQTFLDSGPNTDKMGDAIGDARQRLEELKKTPGKLRLNLIPNSAPRLAITVDGGSPKLATSLSFEVAQPSPDAPPLSYRTITLAPGHHRLGVFAEGYDAVSQELDLTFAETRNVTVILSPTPPPLPPPAPPAALPIAEAPPAPPPPSPPAPRSDVPAFALLGLAGAGLVTGVVYGVLALNAKSSFNAPGGATNDNADKVDRDAIVSDMCFGIALTFGVTGAVLLATNKSPEPPTALASTRRATGVRGFLRPYAGPSGGGAVGVLQF